MFTLFSYQQPTYYHIISSVFFSYLLTSSFELYILCNITYTRSWLESFLGKKFLIDNLGNNTCSKPLLVFLTGLVLICGIEFLSLFFYHMQVEQDLETLHNFHLSIFGAIENWSLEQKDEGVKAAMKIIVSFKTGVIGELMSYLFK